MNLFWHRCRNATFKVLYVAVRLILAIENSKLRASAYKLYRWMASKTEKSCTFSAQSREIERDTGLSARAVTAARKQLVELKLITAERLHGPAGGYRFTLYDPNGRFGLGGELMWNSYAKLPRYIVVPHASMLLTDYADRWSGTDALGYDILCDMMSRVGRNELPLTKRHWFDGVHKATLASIERTLQETGYIRVNGNVIEMLNPETAKAMPAKAADIDWSERTYYADPESGQRKLFTEEQISPAIAESYFRKSLPRGDEWFPGNNAHCAFHDDNTPSLSINVDTCEWYCHSCDVGGKKLVSFEMKLMDTEDIHKAWASVAKKIGYKLAPRNRGKVTHRHEYRDEHGFPAYVVRRHEDGSASYRRYTNYPLTTAGLGKQKRLLYNLPNVIRADVVIIVEGEKKADILSELSLTDESGNKVAITTTGGAESWRLEFGLHLRGKRVLILPDSDQPGERYRDSVVASLGKLGIEHRVVSFEEYGNDVRDFLEQNNTTELVEYIDSDWLAEPTPAAEHDPHAGEITI